MNLEEFEKQVEISRRKFAAKWFCIGFIVGLIIGML